MLELLAKNHLLWVKMVCNMGCPKHLCEDIVQEMYLKINRLVKDKRKIMYGNDDVNRFYVLCYIKKLI